MKELEHASAFAVYTGKVSPTKGQKKRRKAKERKSLEGPLSKIEKIDIIQKKKEKKKKILQKNGIEPGEEKIGKQLKKKTFLQPNNERPSNKIVKKKNKKLQSTYMKTSNVSTTENLPTHDNHSSLEPEKSESIPNYFPQIKPTLSQSNQVSGKKKKKVEISSQLPPKKKTGFKKVVVSTPRFNRKPHQPKSIVNANKSNVLNLVDSYISKKHEDQNEENAPKSTILQKLALEAKTIAEKQGSSGTYGEATLQKILEPFSVKSFLRDNWEKKPLHVPGRVNKFKSFISTEMIDSVLRDNIVVFGKHLDVTTYTDGQRETHNPEGRAHAHVVWDFYSNGCSVRLLNPQYFMNTIHILCSHLQELFGCFVGANVYLTPPNSQGFAPHYDDIEAIILQVEGSKIWKIYSPINKNGYLPRFSSRNLTNEEVGEPIMEVTLKAGDVLYFPRGFIHQARTDDQHSLHITLSTYQQTSWFDFMEKLLPLTLRKACNQDVEFRKGMPLGYLESAGLAYKTANQKKKLIVERLKELMKKMTDFLEVDSAVDEMGLKFIQEALPPVLTPREAACSVLGGGLRMENNGKLSHQIEFIPDVRVRWLRNYCFRVLEEDVTLENGSIERQTRIYYTLDNSKEYRKEEPQFIIIPPDMVPAVVHLVSAYPEYTKISDLPAPNDDDKVILVGDLWDRGLLMTDKPLKCVEYSENDITKEESLSKEEAEVFADLLEAVPHGHEEDGTVSEDDSTSSIENGNVSSMSSESIKPDQNEETLIQEDSESETDSVIFIPQ